MTKKRFQKLTRAYFTRLNEWAKANNSKTMDMGEVYKCLSKLGNNLGEDAFGRKITREDWWNSLGKCGSTFGVGVKEGKGVIK